MVPADFAGCVDCLFCSCRNARRGVTLGISVVLKPLQGAHEVGVTCHGAVLPIWKLLGILARLEFFTQFTFF